MINYDGIFMALFYCSLTATAAACIHPSIHPSFPRPLSGRLHASSKQGHGLILTITKGWPQYTTLI